MQFLEVLLCLEFQIEKMRKIYPNIFGHSEIRLCHKIRGMLSFLPLVSNSVTIRLSFLLLSNHIIKKG